MIAKKDSFSSRIQHISAGLQAPLFVPKKAHVSSTVIRDVMNAPVEHFTEPETCSGPPADHVDAVPLALP